MRYKVSRAKLWTPERKKELKTLCDLGFRRKEIAKRMGLEYSQVKAAMGNFKYKNNRGPIGGWKGKRRDPSTYKPLEVNPNPPVPDGSISPDERSIKVNGKWVGYRNYLWEKHKGPVPEGRIVRKIDVNKPVSIDNLILVTKGEHAKLNYNREKSSQTVMRLHRENPGFNKPDKAFNPQEFKQYYS